MVALTICFIFVGVTSSFAEPLPGHTWELGSEISRIIYEEPDLMKEEGIMYGVTGSYTYPYYNNFILKAEGKGSVGEVDYTGSLSDGTPITMNNIEDYMLEIRGVGGYDFSILGASTIITLYMGIGYRYLNDNLSSSIYGYERESNYFYSPIGIEAITNLGNDWSVGAILEYDYFWWGKQKSHLSDVYPGFSDLENDQKKGYGWRGSVKLQKKGKKVGFVIEPFMRYWNIKKSDEKLITLYGIPHAYGWEPKNNSTEFGVKLAVKF